MPVKYERVDRNLVHEIFTKHILKGSPLLDRVLDGPLEKFPDYELLASAQRPLRLEGRGDLRGVAARQTQRRRAIGRSRPRHPRQLFWRLRAGPCRHLLSRLGPAR